MSEILDREELLTRFLLGEATERERAEVEDRLLSDGEFYERLLAAEGDLMDSYVRGALAKRERARFEESYLSSARLQERVEFARSLVETTTRLHEPGFARPALASAASSNRGGLFASLFAWRAPVRYALASAVLVVLGIAVWIAVARMRARPPIGPQQARTQGVAPPQPTRDALQKAGVAKNQQEQGGVPSPPGNPTPDVSQGTQPAIARPVFATITLAPGSLRDGAAAGNLFIPRAASHLQLRLQLEDDLYQSYRATISTPEGQKVWAGAARKDRQKDAQSVMVTLPAGSIKRGDYIVELSGTITGGRSEPAAKYSFRVTRED